jgi:hypothetical protein
MRSSAQNDPYLEANSYLNTESSCSVVISHFVWNYIIQHMLSLWLKSVRTESILPENASWSAELASAASRSKAAAAAFREAC